MFSSRRERRFPRLTIGSSDDRLDYSIRTAPDLIHRSVDSDQVKDHPENRMRMSLKLRPMDVSNRCRESSPGNAHYLSLFDRPLALAA